MFSVLVKSMLVIFMLAGIAGVIYGVWEIFRTVGYVAASTGRAPATFLGYHRELHSSTTIRPYSPANPNMISTTKSHAVAIYPEFAYRLEQGVEQVVRESKVHVFAIYEPGEEVEVLLSGSDNPRLASFYSLYFRDLLILMLGLVSLLLAMFFWNVALPEFSKPHPVEVYSDSSQLSTDSTGSQQSSTDSTSALESESVEDTFNSMFDDILNTKIGPLEVRHILYGSLILIFLMIFMCVFFGNTRP